VHEDGSRTAAGNHIHGNARVRATNPQHLGMLRMGNVAVLIQVAVELIFHKKAIAFQQRIDHGTPKT
jgi:hypothetical protein